MTQASTPIMDLELCSFDMTHSKCLLLLHVPCQHQSCSGVCNNCRGLEGKDSNRIKEPGALHANATATFTGSLPHPPVASLSGSMTLLIRGMRRPPRKCEGRASSSVAAAFPSSLQHAAWSQSLLCCQAYTAEQALQQSLFCAALPWANQTASIGDCISIRDFSRF